MKLAPSILTADAGDLHGAVRACELAGVDWVHFDVMDGRFVPNLTFGAPVLKALRQRSRLGFDVHLMVEEPAHLLDDFLRSGATVVTVHWEACRHLDRALAQIREAGAMAGVALNPATPASQVFDMLEVVDLVLVMSVNPGFGGQTFIPYTLDKVRRLATERASRGLDFLIEIDGGVGAGNWSAVAGAGVDVAVAGSAVFGSEHPVATMRSLHGATVPRKTRESEK